MSSRLVLLAMSIASNGCAATPRVDSAAACPNHGFWQPNVEVREARNDLRLGGHRLSAELCSFDVAAPEMKSDWSSTAIRSMHGTPDGALIVVANDGVVRRFVVAPGEECRLWLDPTFGTRGELVFPGDSVNVTVLESGTILGEAFGETYRYKLGVVSRAKCRGVQMVVGGAKAGFTLWNQAIERVDVAGSCDVTDWPLEGWGEPARIRVRFMRPWGDDVVVVGSVGNAHYVAIHDLDGKQKIKFGKSAEDVSAKREERFCWVRDADVCNAGACVLDSNCQRLSAWDTHSGAFVGAVALHELLGLENPWPVDLVVGKSAAFLAVSHQEKPNGVDAKLRNAHHVGMIYRIRGLN